MRYLLVVNPESGRGRAKGLIMKIKVFFDLHGHDITIAKTHKAGDATRLTRRHRARHDVIIACGGDGTINEVINGLMGSRKPLAIIPLGTENVLAQYLGIPSDIGKACLCVLEGRPRRVDVGMANGRYFILMTGIGFDAHVASKVQPLLKKLLGSAAYHLMFIKEVFAYEPAQLAVTIGKRRYLGYYVLVGNCRYYGGNIPLAYRAKIDDGLLDICIFRSPQIYNHLRYLASATVLGADLFHDVIYVRARRLHIASLKPTLVHTDCEVIGTTPVDISVKKRALRVIC